MRPTSPRKAADVMPRLLLAAAAVGAATLAAYARPAHAQVFNTGPAGLAQQMPRVYAPYLANISRVKVLEKRVGPPARAQADTTFRTVGPAFVPRKLAGGLGKTPEDRREIEAVLAKCLDHYVGGARQKGVPLNDVARALNYYLATNYVVFSEGKRTPTIAELDASRATIRANMLADPTFQRMSDRQKQESYETLIVLAGFVDLGYGTAKQNGDANAAARFREMAGHNLATVLGVPADSIRFTSKGLETR